MGNGLAKATAWMALASWGIAAAMPVDAAARCAPRDSDAVAGAMRAMYDAVMHDDAGRLAEIFTPDFYAYDNGRRFDGMALPELIKGAHAAGKVYRWAVTRPEVHIDCTTAWIAYVNDGAVGDASAMHTQSWLESAALRWERGRWRVAFLHSTRAG